MMENSRMNFEEVRKKLDKIEREAGSSGDGTLKRGTRQYMENS